MQALGIGSSDMTAAIDAAAVEHTATLPCLRNLVIRHAWQEGGGQEWSLAPRCVAY